MIDNLKFELNSMIVAVNGESDAVVAARLNENYYKIFDSKKGMPYLLNEKVRNNETFSIYPRTIIQSSHSSRYNE